ncbi:MAG: ABC transporter permease subunit [Gracilibacteraceae bacterium]|nr:ABC transporter permease subunit [Gracilibacteraceae bacterium]
MTPDKTAARQKSGTRLRLWAVLLWLAVWEIGSRALGQSILLVSPFTVMARLSQLAGTGGFWQAVFFSCLRIIGGFLTAATLGVIAAALAARLPRVRELLAPLMLVVKSTPVASFIILLLIWVPSKNLSVVIAFLMVLPVIYTNVLGGILDTDPQLLEMAQVFRLPARRVIRYIYVSQVLPYFRAACAVSLGLCWKAGVAAEVIGIPTGSLGERLYTAKIFLQTADIFAWTLVIILISLLFEKLFMWILRRGIDRLERM